MTTTSGVRRQRHRITSTKLAPYVFVLPNLLVVLAFAIYPLVANAALSFTDGSSGSGHTVGLDNYRRLGDDPAVIESISNTLFFTLLLVPVTIVLSLLIAVAMNRPMPLKNLLRAAYLIPYLLSWSVTGLVWRDMFSTDNGLINSVLSGMGLPRLGWILDPPLVIPSLALVGIWAGLGYYMMVYLAGLQSIPSVLYEAASMDGASKWQQFRYITLPALRPITALVLVLSVTSSFRVFEEIYVMTGGGPGRSSFVLVLYIFIQGFTEFSLGYAATIAVVLFASIAIVTVLLQKLSDREQQL
jgi:ABC-type sugar transport system permease subunit